MSFCNKCGNPIPEGNKFCSKCGAPVDGTAPKVQPAVIKSSNAPVAPKPVKAKKEKKSGSAAMVIAIILGVIVLLAGLSVGGYYVYSNVISADKDSDDEEDTKKKKKKDEADEEDEEKDSEEADAEEEVEKVEEAVEVNKEEIILDEYAKIVLKNIDGKKLYYDEVDMDGYAAWVPENLGEEGCIYAVMDETQNGDPVMYDVRYTDDGESTSLILEAVTVDDTGALVEETEPIGCIAGKSASNDFCYRVLRQDDNFVLSYYESYCVMADGVNEVIKVLSFKNGKWETIEAVDAAGSDIGSPDWEDYFDECASKLKAVGLTETAKAIQNGNMRLEVAPGEDVDPLIAVAGRLRGTEDWDYNDFRCSIFQMYDAWDAYIFPNSSTDYLDENDVRKLSSDDLRLARNEIYARHGRKFKDEELQKYFNGQYWYSGYTDEVSENQLSDIEKANRDLISSFE